MEAFSLDIRQFENINRMRKGMIFDIKRYAIHDGPGIRTTVFLKGCPLNCLWCHNPEGKAMDHEFMWWAERCIGCRDCETVCDREAISFSHDSLILDKTKCNLCRACVDVCHSHALELVGKEVTVTQVMKEIEKDNVFYDESGGGVTLSGGEPLMQPNFSHSIFKACKELRVHTAVDTCGYVNSDDLLKISKHVDLFLYDLKVINDKKHTKLTGVSNKLILENLRELSRNGREIIVRFTLVPGVNDNEEDVLELGTFVSSLKNVQKLSILTYHKAGAAKIKRLTNPRDSLLMSPLTSSETLNAVEQRLKTFGLKVRIGG